DTIIYMQSDHFQKATKNSTNNALKENLVKPEEPKIIRPPEIDANLYINSSTKVDIAILIINKDNVPISSISSKVVDYLQEKGYTVNPSLFTRDFYYSPALQKLEYADANLISKLSLSSYAKCIFIGRYS